MKINPYPNPFIVVEGIDGCGKSTLIEGIAKWDKKYGVGAVYTEEPTERFLPGQKIHRILRNDFRDEDGQKMMADEFERLYVFDRLESRGEEILVLPKRPVIKSRDFPSTLCYSMALGLPSGWSLSEHEKILGDLFFIPDLILILDLFAEEAMKRIKFSNKTPDYFEKKLEFLKKVREAYLGFPRLMKEIYPDISSKIQIIDAMQPPEKVFKDSLFWIDKVFQEKLEATEYIKIFKKGGK